jgi:general nucleoside transport system ATP-binding protein
MEWGSEGTPAPHLQLSGISKTWPENGIKACRDISFDAEAGEIVSVVGENGSGKSTLMKVLCGHILPDAGKIRIGDEDHLFSSPAQALNHGIGMIQQQVQLIPRFTVLENLMLGNEPLAFPGRIDRKKAGNRLSELADRYGIPFEPSKRAGHLNAVERQNLSLLYLLSRNVHTLVLDEPTTIFEDDESEYLYRLMNILREEGRILLLVSHKLREALQLSRRIVILREGSVAAIVESAKTDQETVAGIMIGNPEREITLPVFLHKGEEGGTDQAAPLLKLEGVSCSHPELPPVHNLSFSIFPGQVLALLGMREAGLETVERLLAGVIRPSGGSFSLFGTDYSFLTPSMLRRKNVAYIPTDRMVRGASSGSTVAENLILLNYRDFHRFASMKDEEINQFTKALFDEYGIKGSAGERLEALSGGNIQKVIIGRELSRTPSLIFFAEPSWGLDIKGRVRVLSKIAAIKNKGSGILLLTSDIDEAISASDHIAVLHSGLLTEVIPTKKMDRTMVGKMMLQGGSHAT